MAVTVEQLEQRVHALEAAMVDLKSVALPPRVDESSADRGKRLLAKARASKTQVQASWAAAYERIGVVGKAVPPEQLRAMMLADGVRPEENLLSRGIREMREE